MDSKPIQESEDKNAGNSTLILGEQREVTAADLEKQNQIKQKLEESKRKKEDKIKEIKDKEEEDRADDEDWQEIDNKFDKDYLKIELALTQAVELCKDLDKAKIEAHFADIFEEIKNLREYTNNHLYAVPNAL